MSTSVNKEMWVKLSLYGVAGDGALPRLIHVMDREGDAYEVMMAVVDAGDKRHHPLCPEPPD